MDDAARAAHTDEELTVLAQRGDKAALNYIIDKYRPLVGHACKGYYIPGADREDLVQEGMIGLYRAVLDFDSARQVRFYFFARLCVERQIITALKSAFRQKHTPLNDYAAIPSADKSDASPEDIVIGREDKATLARIMASRLSDFENRVMLMHLAGYSRSEIGERLSCTYKTIDNAMQRARRKMRR